MNTVHALLLNMKHISLVQASILAVLIATRFQVTSIGAVPQQLFELTKASRQQKLEI